MRILVYGTLKRGQGNHDFIAESKFIEAGEYLFLGHKLVRGGLPFLVEVPVKDTGLFYGEIYEVDLRTLENLDALEGHPDCYKRTYIPNIDAWTYVYQWKDAKNFPQIYSYGA